MNELNDITQERIVREVAQLPYGFDDISDTLRRLAAVLRLHGFSVKRADDAKEYVSPTDVLEAEMGYPSMWLYEKNTLQAARDLRLLSNTDSAYIEVRNDIVRQNLKEQTRLLELLGVFYSHHQPASIHARLVVRPVYEDGEFCLAPQGSDCRIVLSETEQRKWYADVESEIAVFVDFLSRVVKH